MKRLRAIPPLAWVLAGLATLLALRLWIVVDNADRINAVRLIINLAIVGSLLAWATVLAWRGKRPEDEQRGLKYYAPVCMLLFLAPWVGEFLLGNVPASRLFTIIFLVPMYGGGALLIREVARRTGRGWPTMLVLAVAYGLIEAGLADQSLFNHHFQGHDFSSTLVPWLGISAYNTLVFIGGHAIWSIGIPIALTELLTPKRRTTPWLRPGGLVAAAALYVLGCVVVFATMYDSERFLATPGQRIGTALVALALIAVAFKLKRPRPASAKLQGSVPSPKRVGVVAFILAFAYFMKPENWGGFVFGLLLLAAAAVVIVHWARHRDWTPRHEFALVAGALPLYALAGFVLTGMLRPGDAIAWVGNVVFALFAFWLLWYTARRLRKTG